MSSFQGCKGSRCGFIIEFLKLKKERTMKRTLIAFLVIVLSACAAPPAPVQQPTAALPEPTQTPIVLVETVVEKVVETVVVTVVPTQPPTEVPSATPPPLPTEAQPTPVAAQPTQPPTAPADPGSGLIAVDEMLGAGWFTDIMRTRNDFSLRCQLNRAITFSVRPADTNIARVDFYYRIQDRETGAIFDWQNAGRMIRNADGSFSLVFSGEEVHANFRKPSAWFDYQFIGSSAAGVVGRSEKIEQQVSFTLDCP
jgi:hypothetical protein